MTKESKLISMSEDEFQDIARKVGKKTYKFLCLRIVEEFKKRPDVTNKLNLNDYINLVNCILSNIHISKILEFDAMANEEGSTLDVRKVLFNYENQIIDEIKLFKKNNQL